MVNFKYFRALIVGVWTFIPGLIFSAEAQSADAQSWYATPEMGWLWYKRIAPLRPHSRGREDVLGQKRRQEDQKNADKACTKNPYPYSVRMESLRKTFEEIQAKAILDPTLQNVQNMQRAQNIIMDRSTAFEKAWMLASLVLGENFRASDQTSPLHRKIYQEQSGQRLDQQIRHCAKTFGLFFIFKKGCPWCHEFAPVVRRFADAYGFEVKAISPDGEPLELFPETVLDNGAITRINPEGIFPCLFLVNPQSRQVIPLSRGLVNDDGLRENFKAIIPFFQARLDSPGTGAPRVDSYGR